MHKELPEREKTVKISSMRQKSWPLLMCCLSTLSSCSGQEIFCVLFISTQPGGAVCVLGTVETRLGFWELMVLLNEALPGACAPVSLGLYLHPWVCCGLALGFWPWPLPARVCREERNQTQVLRQQQDEAYLASLRADQEKERKKKEERERKKKKEEEVQQQKLAEERRRQVSANRLLERLLPRPAGCAGGVGAAPAAGLSGQIQAACLARGGVSSEPPGAAALQGMSTKVRSARARCSCSPSLLCRRCRRRRSGSPNAFLPNHIPMTPRAWRSFSSCLTIPEWSGDSTSHSHWRWAWGRAGGLPRVKEGQEILQVAWQSFGSVALCQMVTLAESLSR